MRLICGCGKKFIQEEGVIGVDIRDFGNVDKVCDLNEKFPFEDNTFTHVSAIHVVEHLNDLIHFMDEAWRVLKEGGDLYIETPCAGEDPDLEFADPTHVRCYRPHTFVNYFTLSGIEAMGYTSKPWSILKCTVENSVLIFHGMPIKRLPQQ